MVHVHRTMAGWILLVMLAVAPSWGYAQQRGSTADEAKVDLGYVTPQAVLAAVVHSRRALTSPDMQMLPIEVLSAAGKKELGIDPLDVDYALVVVEPPLQGPPGLGIVIRLLKPYRMESLKLLRNQPLTDAQIDGRPYRQSRSPMVPGVYMPDDQTLIVATDGLLKKMLANRKTPQAGPLGRVMAATDTSADAVVVTVLQPIRPMLVAQLDHVPIPAPFAGVKRLPELIDAAKVELSVTGGQRGALTLLAPSDKAAEELAGVLDQLLDTGQQLALAKIASESRNPEDPVEKAMAQYGERIIRHISDMIRPKRDGRKLQVSFKGEGGQAATIGVLVSLLLPAVQSAREAARRAQSSNNLKQIALGMHNYYDAKRSFPACANFDANGKPLLSWRVHILPYLDENALYKQFHLDEPWDSPHNKTLIPLMPKVYANPSAPPTPGKASYLVPTGKGSIFEGQKGTTFRDITDGMSNTILVVEVNSDASVIWTKPEDLKYDTQKPLRGLGRAHPGGFQVAFADGSVHFLSAAIDPKLFLLRLMMADGNVIPDS